MQLKVGDFYKWRGYVVRIFALSNSFVEFHIHLDDGYRMFEIRTYEQFMIDLDKEYLFYKDILKL